jgi:SAM-dependent methyltransferase
VLDYGCGDGTFLALLTETAVPPAVAIGADLDERTVEDCKSRLGSRSGLQFVLTTELDAPEHAGAYSGIICMEVLEHVIQPDRLLDRLHRLLRPGGALIVSVPVETGLPVVLKQAIRRIAGWFRVGDYPGTTPYTWKELWAAIFAGSQPHIDRPVHRSDIGDYHDHKGFNWKALAAMVESRFDVEQVVSSPLTALPPGFGSQVWLVARKRV